MFSRFSKQNQSELIFTHIICINGEAPNQCLICSSQPVLLLLVWAVLGADSRVQSLGWLSLECTEQENLHSRFWCAIKEIYQRKLHLPQILKRNECSLLVSLPPVKIIFLKIDFACVLKMESLSTPFHKAFAFFLNKMLQFLETEAALYIK